MEAASSCQRGLDGGAESPTTPAPANIPSSEKDYYRKPLLRRVGLLPEDTAPHSVLRLGLALPELVDRGGCLLRSDHAGRRRQIVHHPSFGQHSFTGGGLLPETSTPASGPFAGGNGASLCPPVRTGFAEAGGSWRLPPPARPCWTEETNRPPPQLRPTFLHRRRTITGNRYSGE